MSAAGGPESRNSEGIYRLPWHISRNDAVLIAYHHAGWLFEVGPGGLEGIAEGVVCDDVPDGFRDSCVPHVVVAQHADDRQVDTSAICWKRMLVFNEPATVDPARIIRRIVEEFVRQAKDGQRLATVRRRKTQMERGDSVERLEACTECGEVGRVNGDRGDVG